MAARVFRAVVLAIRLDRLPQQGVGFGVIAVFAIKIAEKAHSLQVFRAFRLQDCLSGLLAAPSRFDRLGRLALVVQGQRLLHLFGSNGETSALFFR